LDDDKEDKPERYRLSGVPKYKYKQGGKLELTDFEREAFINVLRELRAGLEKK
jgi:hypothetical protein